MYLNHAVSVEVAFGENFCRRSIFREAWTHFKTPAGNVSVKTGSNPKLVLTSTGEPVFSAEGSLSEHGESCRSADTTGWLWRCTHSKHALRNQSERCTDMLILRDGSLVYGGCDNSSVCIRVCVCVYSRVLLQWGTVVCICSPLPRPAFRLPRAHKQLQRFLQRNQTGEPSRVSILYLATPLLPNTKAWCRKNIAFHEISKGYFWWRTWRISNPKTQLYHPDNDSGEAAL